VDVAAVAADDVPPSGPERFKVAAAAVLGHAPPGEFVRDDVKEQFGQQQPGRVTEPAPAVDVEPHGGGRRC